MTNELEYQRHLERLGNMGLRGAEQLVAELAAGRAGKDFKPTETQKELNIPVFLIYLLGIVIAEEQYLHLTAMSVNETPQKNFSSAREKRFAEFQKLFLESANADQCQAQDAFVSQQPDVSVFKFTNRMLPSKDQQEIISNDLFHECDKLQHAADEALEALLEEERTLEEQQKAKSKRKNKKKKKKQQAKKRNNDQNLNPNGENGTKREATKVAVKEPCVEMGGNSSEGTENNHTGVAQPEFIETNDGDVIVCANSLEDQIFWQEGLCDSNPEELAFMKIIARNSKSGAVEKPKAPSNEATIGTLLDDFKIPRSPEPAACEASTTDDTNLPTTDNDELTQRIAHLEHELAAANRKSEEERKAHAKALRTQKEKYENLIQSLQLRLYISENKVRTYEEALEQHIASISTIKRGNANQTNGDVERIPGSPSLISKVLESKRIASINGEV